MMTVYVVAFEPFENRASMGGLDWFYKQSDAEQAFRHLVSENAQTHSVRLLAVSVASRSQDAVTQELDDKIWHSDDLSIINSYQPET